MLIKGQDLTTAQRAEVLAAYLYRWTKENPRRVEMWRKVQGQPTMALISDEEWLRDHAFHFVKDGSRLMANRQHAEPACLAEEVRT